MNTVSLYVFRQALGPLVAGLVAIAALAILTSGLKELDIIISNRRAILTFAWVTLLTLPQIVSTILPLAIGAAVGVALLRMQRESEVAVLYGAGVSRRGIGQPAIQLATLAALLHLTINVLIQPAAFEERRQMLYSLRADLASSLIEEGSFTTPAEGLTLYARTRGAGGELRDLLIHDARRPEAPITYSARAGAIVTEMRNGEPLPAIVLRNGQVHRQSEEGFVDVLDFDRYVLELGEGFQQPELFYLKASDRTLYQLFFPDRTAHYDQRNIEKFLAEAHGRLSAPLLNIALAMIALVGVMGGEFRRQGYWRRMAATSAAAVLVWLVWFGVQAAAADAPEANILQYAVPVGAILAAGFMLGGAKARNKRLTAGPSVLAEA